MFGIGSALNAAHSRKHSGHEMRGRDGRFHGRYNRAGAASGTMGERLLCFFGSKVGEIGSGIGLGAMQAYGDPLFFSDDPAKAWGPKLLGSLLFNGIELVQLWKGWSASRVLGPKAGVFVDGIVSGAASGCTAVYAFDNSNTFFAAKIEQSNSVAASKGVDYAERRQLHAPAEDRPAIETGAVRTPALAAKEERERQFNASMREADEVGRGAAKTFQSLMRFQ